MKPWIKLAGVAALSFVAGMGAMLFSQKHKPAGYAGWEAREIKALSADDIAGLKEGKGLGYALSAELNGYPGPRHVLELAGKLSLTGEQKRKTEELFAEMKAKTSALGVQLITAERILDQSFAADAMDQPMLENLTREAAVLNGKLRAAHLGYHLAMMDVLSPQQVKDYSKLRGYAAGGYSGH